MSERQPRSRRRRRRNRGRGRRPAVIEEGGSQTDAAEAAPDEDHDSGHGRAERPSTERRRGARVQRDRERRKTILGLPRMIFFIMAGLVVVIIVTTIANQLVTPSDDIAGARRFPDQGRRHLAAGEDFALDDYNTYPPTSGPQAEQGATPGIYGPGEEDEAFQQPPPFAELLPILERGGIVIYYDPGRVSDIDLGALKRSFVEPARAAGLTLLSLVALDLAPPDGSPIAPIVATAWRHTLEIEVLDEAAQDLLRDFITPAPAGLYLRFVLDPRPPAPSGAQGS